MEGILQDSSKLVIYREFKKDRIQVDDVILLLNLLHQFLKDYREIKNNRYYDMERIKRVR